MKKNLLMLLIVIVIAMPFNVNAEEVKLTCKKKAGDDLTVSNADCTFEALTVPADKKIDLSTHKIVLKFNSIGSAVEEDTITIVPDDEFTQVKSGNTVVLTSKNETVYESGKKINLGKLAYTYSDGDIETDADCQLKVSITFEKIKTENPQTGISMPMIAVGTLGLITVGLYVSTKNKNKIYNV